MVLVRTANLTVAFLLELAMLVAFGLWGFDLDRSLPVRLLAGLGLPILVAGFWGAFLAPTSTRRIRMPWIALVKIVLYGLAAIALAATRHPTLGLVVFTAALVSIGLAVLLRQEEVVTPGGATGAAGPTR